jgi:predicted SprT family Zn-dependent metalloprotease
MEIPEARDLARQLMSDHGLPAKGWRLRFDNAKTLFGRCYHKYKKISLSIPLTKANEEAQVRDAILHEIAHSIAGPGAGHGPEWKKIAIEIGATPKARCGKDVSRPKGKFLYECPNCKKVVDKYKRLQGRKACSECCRDFANGQFDERFLLVPVGPGQEETPELMPEQQKETNKQAEKDPRPAGPPGSDAQETKSPELVIQSRYDPDEIKKQLESRFRTRIPGDDALWLAWAGIDLIVNAAWEANAKAISDFLTSRLEGFNKAVDQCRKQMDDSSAEKLKLLNEELMAATTAAIENVNVGRNLANQYLITALVELRSLVTEIQTTYRVNVWKERILGIIIAGALAAVSFLSGVALK